MKRKGQRRVQRIFNINKREISVRGIFYGKTSIKNEIIINLLKAWNVLTRFPPVQFLMHFSIVPSVKKLSIEPYWHSSRSSIHNTRSNNVTNQMNTLLAWLFMNVACNCSFLERRMQSDFLLFWTRIICNWFFVTKLFLAEKCKIYRWLQLDGKSVKTVEISGWNFRV